MTMLLALIAAVQSAPAPATAPNSSAATAAAPSAAALRVAGQLASNEMVLSQTRRVLRQQLPTALAANPDMSAMEKQFPGIGAEFVSAMEPIIIASLERRLPSYQRDVATIFDKRLTAAELAQVSAFYASPAGLHMLQLVREGADFSAMLNRQIATGGEAPISGAELTAAIRPAIQPAVAGLSDAEQLTLMRFGMTSAGRKMTAINDELLALAVRFNNEKDPKAEAEVEKAVMALVARHAGAKKR